jgi:FlaA1/EpsC-like NDP-sugar epimerase
MLGWIEARTRTQKGALLVAIDLFLIPVAGLLALALFLGLSVLPTASGALAILPPIALLSACCSVLLGIPRIQLSTFEMAATGRAALLAASTASCAAILGWLAGLAVPPGAYVTFGLLFFLLSVVTRLALRGLIRYLKNRATPRLPVVIYGAGTTGVQLAQALKDHDHIMPIALVDDNPALQGLQVAGLTVLHPARLPRFAEPRGVRRVLLAMPSVPRGRQAQIATQLQGQGFEVQALPSFAQLVGTETLIDKLTPVSPDTLLGRDSHRIDVVSMGGIYAGKSVLISGAGGSIGSELCRQLIGLRPRRLILFELSELALYEVERELRVLVGSEGTEIVPILGSVTDPRHVQRVIETHGVEVILHAAAYKHVPLVEANPLAGLANNVLGTHTLAGAARKFGVERFILISTDKAVRPASVMGASKRLSEMVVRDLALRSESTIFATVRFGNVLGSSGSVIPLFQAQIAAGGPITLTHEQITRYFMTIEEAVRLVLRAGALANGGEIFVLDMGAPVAIRDLARRIVEASGHTVRDEANPNGDIEIVTTGLRPGEKLHEELTSGSGLTVTTHPKIMTAREPGLTEIEVASALRALRSAVGAGDNQAARQVLARWVAHYNVPDAAQAGSQGPG